MRKSFEDRPRVRPSIWALVLIVGGGCFLHLVWAQGWMAGVVGIGMLSYRLAWAMPGVLYALAATELWGRLVPGTGKLGSLGLFFGILTILIVAGQIIAAPAVDDLAVHVTGIRWDGEEREFVIEVLAYEGTARALERGVLRVEFSIMGHAGTVRKDATGNDYTTVVELFIEDDARMLHRRSALRPSDMLRILGRSVTLRLPFQPRLEEYGVVVAEQVSAVLLDGSGEEVGEVTGADFTPWPIVGSLEWNDLQLRPGVPGYQARIRNDESSE